MEAYIPTIISSIVGGLVVCAGSYMAMNTRLTRIETKLDENIKNTSEKIDFLREDVEKHNNLVERMAVAERDLKTAFVRIDENRDELRNVKIGGTA